MQKEGPSNVHPRMRSVDRRAMLRPLTSSEVLDAGTQIYRRIARHVLPKTLAASSLCAAAFVFCTTFILPNLFVTTTTSTGAEQFTEAAMAILVTLLVGGPLFIVGLANATGPVIRMASDCMMGDEPKLRSAELEGSASVHTLTGVLFGVILRAAWIPALGLIAMALSVFADSLPSQFQMFGALPAILGIGGLAASFFMVPYVIHRTALAPVICIVEGQTGGRAVKRAGHLMSQDKSLSSPLGASVSFFFMAIFVYGAVSLGVYGFLQFLNIADFLTSFTTEPWAITLIRGVTDAIPLWVSLWLIVPFWGSVITALYYDRRVRHEGFDIKTLNEDIAHADRQTALLN